MNRYSISSLITLLFMTAILASCSQDSPLLGDEGTIASRSEKLTYYRNVVDTAKTVTTDRAKKIALGVASGDAMSRYATKMVGNVETICDENGSPLMYVVNYAGEQGFAIVSATTDYYPVLAMADKGHFDTSITADSPVSIWITEQKNAIKKASKLSAEAQKEVASEWTRYNTDRKRVRPEFEPSEHPQVYYDSLYRWNADANIQVYTYEEYLNSLSDFEREQLLSNNYILQAIILQGGMETHEAIYNTLILKVNEVQNTIVDPLMTTIWYNHHTYKDPRLGEKAIGCLTIAVGQIMKFHKYPVTYQWQAMPDDSASDVTKAFLYDLRNELGITDDEGTGNFLGAEKALKKYGYSTTIKNYNAGGIATEISQYHCPVLMQGVNPNTDEGHAWVCDGFKKYRSHEAMRVMTFTYRDEMTGQGEMVEVHRDESFSTPSFYLYCNWGIGGWGNGYYRDGDFKFSDIDFTSHNKQMYIHIK